MPVTKSAKKKLRVDRRRRQVNLPVISRMKTALKKAKEEPSLETVKEAYSAIDRAKKKGIIKANKAARLKSRLIKTIKKKLDKSVFEVKKKVVKKTAKKTATGKQKTRVKKSPAKRTVRKATSKK